MKGQKKNGSKRERQASCARGTGGEKSRIKEKADGRASDQKGGEGSASAQRRVRESVVGEEESKRGGEGGGKRRGGEEERRRGGQRADLRPGARPEEPLPTPLRGLVALAALGLTLGPKLRLWMLWLTFIISSPKNKLIRSACAWHEMWKFPGTFFTSIQPCTLQPSPR